MQLISLYFVKEICNSYSHIVLYDTSNTKEVVEGIENGVDSQHSRYCTLFFTGLSIILGREG